MSVCDTAGRTCTHSLRIHLCIARHLSVHAQVTLIVRPWEHIAKSGRLVQDLCTYLPSLRRRTLYDVIALPESMLLEIFLDAFLLFELLSGVLYIQINCRQTSRLESAFIEDMFAASDRIGSLPSWLLQA